MKFFIHSFIVALTISSAQALAYKKNNLLTVSTHFVAKELCSCIFVEENSKTFCKKRYKENFDFLRRVKIKNNLVSVSYLGLLYKAKAKFTNPKLGCKLVK